MNEFQANLCTFFIKDKEKKEFVKNLVMDKSFYYKVTGKSNPKDKPQVKVLSRYEKLEARKKEIGGMAAMNEYLSAYLKPVQEAVQRELQDIKEESEPANSPIFTMWLQDNPPEVIQMCFDSIRRFYPELTIITEKNMADYVDVPDYIWKKFRDGIIPAAHFSDYVRSALLDKYGGIWIDSTYYMIAPIPQYLLKAPHFILKTETKTACSNNFFKFAKNNYFIKTMRIYLEQYWKNEDKLVEYHIFHLFFMLSVRNDPRCASIWNEIPYCLNTNTQFIGRMLSQDFDEDVLKYVRQTSFMYKLTYKDKNAENNPNSWFWYLINQWRQGILLTSALEHEL